MKKMPLLIPLLILVAVTVVGQGVREPAPEQCRADSDAWGIPKTGALVLNENQVWNFTDATMRDAGVTVRMLDDRIHELNQCIRTDSVQSARYAEGQRLYSFAELGRMADFILRHKLGQQFYQEDDQGKR
jgi:hypothetical protein